MAAHAAGLRLREGVTLFFNLSSLLSALLKDTSGERPYLRR